VGTVLQTQRAAGNSSPIDADGDLCKRGRVSADKGREGGPDSDISPFNKDAGAAMSGGSEIADGMCAILKTSVGIRVLVGSQGEKFGGRRSRNLPGWPCNSVWRRGHVLRAASVEFIKVKGVEVRKGRRGHDQRPLCLAPAHSLECHSQNILARGEEHYQNMGQKEPSEEQKKVQGKTSKLGGGGLEKSP